MNIADLDVKIFADGADIDGMLDMYRRGFVKGFTTNPTLMKKAGVKNYESFAKSVLSKIADLPISFEVFSDDFKDMERQARIINSWGKNVFVKIPVSNTEGKYSYGLIKTLSEDGVKINATALLTIEQVENVLKALSGGAGAYISVFAGRIADTGIDPEPVMKETASLCKTAVKVESLWASTRQSYDIVRAAQCGVNIITVTNDILKKLNMFGKDLDELSLETVKMFYNDAKESGFNI
ncbi:MAG: transaldolase [Elusimicrobiota bacterium]|jgi:transaldolase|nr:transaldolase [Elusimicrobiota bacterium]